jgi:hypothetical protein
MARKSGKMSSGRITLAPAQLAAVLREQLNNYSADAARVVEDSVKEALDAGLRELERAGTYTNRSGRYRRSFRVETDKTYTLVSGRLYSADYPLTHLLEFGHKTANNRGRTRAFPHWAPTERTMTEDFEKRLREGIEGIGG